MEMLACSVISKRKDQTLISDIYVNLIVIQINMKLTAGSVMLYVEHVLGLMNITATHALIIDITTIYQGQDALRSVVMDLIWDILNVMMAT